VTPPTDAGTITGPANVCPGAVITVADLTTDGAWTASNANVTLSPAGVITGVTAGTTDIYYTVTNGCGSIATSETITVVPMPVAGLILGITSVCKGESVTLSDPTAIGTGTWSASNSHSTVSATGSVSGITPGVDTIFYAAVNMCGSATASQQIIVNNCGSAGVAITSNDPAINIFPNPASSVLNIDWNNFQPGNATISITDVTGKIVSRNELINNASGTGSMEVNVANLKDGIYLLTISSEQVHFTNKITIAK